MLAQLFARPYHLANKDIELILHAWLGFLSICFLVNYFQQFYLMLILAGVTAAAVLVSLLILQRRNIYWPVIFATCFFPALGVHLLSHDNLHTQIAIIWSFPAIMILYVFMRPKTALLFNIIFILSIAPQLIHYSDPMVAPRLVIAHITVSLFLFFSPLYYSASTSN